MRGGFSVRRNTSMPRRKRGNFCGRGIGIRGGRDTLKVFGQQLGMNGEGMSSMVEAAIFYLKNNGPISVGPGPWRGDQGTRPQSPQEVAGNVVSMQAAWVSPRELHVQLGIQEGFHINANKAGKDLIATQLSINHEDVESINYPAGEKTKFGFSD